MKRFIGIAILCVVSSGAVFAQPTGNPFVYDNVDDQFLSCQGIASRLSSYCTGVGNFNDRQMCAGLAESNQNPCRSITDRDLQLTCYGMAFAPNFPSNCRDIADANLQRFCYSASSYSSSLCNDIPDANTRLLCFAMSNRSSSFCANITERNDQKFCMGVSLHDVSYCVKEQPPERGDGKAVIQYTGDRSGDFHDPATLSAVLLDAARTPALPIRDAVLTFRLGQQACKAPTDAQGRASCSLTPEMAAGDRPLSVGFSGDFVHAAAQASDTFTVGHEQSRLAITSPPVGPGIPASVRAVLREDGAVPIAGRQVLFEAGAVSATASTGADGAATAQLALPAGDHLVTASFAGDDFYASTSATQTLRVLPPQIAILPQSNAAPAGSSQAVTAQILDGGVSFPGERLGFEVLSGPNAGATGVCDAAACASDASGRATFRYTGGPAGGRDTVRVWLDLNHNGVFDAGEAQATASLHWTVRHPTAILVAGPQGGDYHDPVRLSAVLLDAASTPGAPVAGALLSLASAAGSCTARTDASGTASCFVTPQTAAGSYALAVDFAGDGRHLSAHAEGTVAITAEQTTLAITSSPALESGSVVARALLREDGSLPVGGRPVTFRAGGQTLSATTDAAGVATATLGLAEGEYTLQASFAGDSFYAPAADQLDRLLVYQREPFVVWGGNAPDLATALPLGATYTFWGARWADQVRAGDFSANPSFKGYAADVFPASGAASGIWRSRPGNSSHPPSTVPAYMGVILSTHIQKDGSVESGDVAGIGVLKVTDPSAYRPNPGHAGTGVLLTVLPPDPASPAGTPPGAPTGVSATVGEGFAEVRWTPPADPGSGPITGYVVTMSPGGLQLAVPAGETSRILPGLAFGTSYQFTVAAVGRAGSGPTSQPSSAVTLLSAPSAPQAVSAVAGNAAATVTWSAPAVDGGSPVLGYVVEPLPDGAPVTVVGPGTTATLTGLDNGTSYTFVVRARSAAGLGAESAPSAAVLPASAPSAPSGLVASAASREATLYWTAPAADGGSALTSYRIVAEPGGLSITVPGARTFARITGLDNAVAYRFTLAAANAQGNGAASAPSDEVIPFGTPGTPGQVQGTPGNGTALMRWSAPSSDGGRPVTGYTVTAEPGGLTAAVPAGETSRLITGLANGTAYTLQVTATNLAGAGAAAPVSAPVTPGSVPDEPTGVQATGANASATVTWVAPATDGGSPISRYVVVTHPGENQVVVDTGALRATVSGLINGTSYSFTVRAANAAGLGPESLRSNFVIPVGPPDAPAGVQAAVGGVAAARVTWSAGANGGKPLTGYTVTSSPGGQAVAVAAPATSVLITNLTVGTAYTFTVTATNQIGTGPASPPSNSLVAATYPGAPTNVTAVEEGGNLRVTWTPPASDGFSPLQAYQIFINPFGADAAKFVGGGTTSLSIGGIPLGVEVSFAVQAINAVGGGPGSALSNPVTRANPPGAPGNVTAAVDGNAGVQVTWTAAAPNSAPITSYTVLSAPGGLTATVDGAATSATLSGLTVGTTYTFTVTATNRKGAGPASAPSNPVRVAGGGGGGGSLTAEIQTPVDGAEVTAPVNVTGSVSGGDWKLEVSLNNADGAATQAWTTLASGSGAVSNGVLGRLDPSQLLNGVYTLRLSSTDAARQTATASIAVNVTGNLKLGNFALSFADVKVPMTGLPIEVDRSYDTRDKRSADFGFGWSLGMRNVRLEKSMRLGEAWEMTSSGGGFPNYCVRPMRPHFVTITFPNGRLYKFQATVSPNCQQLAPLEFTSVAYQQVASMAGTQGASLAAIRPDDSVQIVGSIPGNVQLIDLDTVEVYNPTLYRLTTAEGYQYTIEQSFGATEVVDPNGNTLTINSGGVIHSSGKSVVFTRDGAGRITRITDPAGGVLQYAYDAAGDLVTFTDRDSHVTTFTYDASHHMLTMTDPNGKEVLSAGYDSDGRLVSQTNAEGKSVNFTNDVDGRGEAITDAQGHSTSVTFDDSGNLLAETDAAGGVTTFTYDARGNRLTRTDANQKTTTYTYDAQDHLLTTTDPLGNVSGVSYDTHGNPLTITDPRGGVTTNRFDARNNLLSTKDAAGRTTAYGYDPLGRRASITTPLGCTTAYEYDTAGNVTKITDGLGHSTIYTFDANGNRLTEKKTRTVDGGGEDLVTTWAYDPNGRLLTVTYPDGAIERNEYDGAGQQTKKIDPLGHVTRYEYDAAGHLLRTIHPDTTVESITYDENGRLQTKTDRDGRTTTLGYDAAGRPNRTTFGDGSFKAVVYDFAGHVTSTANERGATTLTEYDGGGRVSRITDALGHSTTFTYDGAGNKLTATDANGHTTTHEYDALNRETKEIYADGTFRQLVYDADGRKIQEIDPAGAVTSFESDCAGRLTKVTDNAGGVTTYGYDEVGNRISQTDAESHTTTFAYDKRGRLVTKTLPLGQQTTMVYDLDGKISSSRDANGVTTTFTYDVEDRLTHKSTPDGAVDSTYTAAGLRNTVVDARGTTAYAYDNRGRVSRVTEPDGRAVSYTYDAAGNRLTVATPAGVTSYTYDLANRLTQVTGAEGVVTYGYDDAGNRLLLTNANGTSAVYTYDSRNRLTDLVNQRADGSVITGHHYTLGAAGNRLRATEDGGRSVDFGYDGVYRLTSEVAVDPVGNRTTTHTYDRAGNRLTKTENGVTTGYVYDADDRLLTEGATTYAYDANGNLTSRIDAGGQTLYAYDSLGRLARVTAPGGVTQYVYDADGNRVQKSSGGTVSNYLVDRGARHAAVLVETDGAGAVRATYTYGDDLLAMRRGGAMSFYHFDGQLSTRALTNALGQTTDRYTFSSFGTLVRKQGTTENEFLYTGQQYDANAGFYYLRARYYDPGTGRFISSDAFGGNPFEPITLHKYVYANDNPANRVDPSGFQASLAELNATVTVSNILDSYWPTLFKLINVAVGVDVFYRPGFSQRNHALELIATGRLGPNGLRLALKWYEAANHWIEFGSDMITATDKAIELVAGAKALGESFLAVRELVEAFHNVPIRSRSYSASQTFSIYLDQVSIKGNSLLRETFSYRTSTVYVMLDAWKDWADFTGVAIKSGLELINSALEIDGALGAPSELREIQEKYSTDDISN